MARSLALSLYLMRAARGGPQALPPRTARPEGALIWLHAGAGARPGSLGQLASRLLRERPALSVLVTTEADNPTMPADLGPGTLADRLPPDRLADLRRFLDHWRPDLLLLAGASLPPALITETDRRAVPMILADIHLGAEAMRHWRWRRGMASALLRRFTRILAQDPDSAARLRALGAPPDRLDMAGRIEETTEPLPCTEAERAALAALLQARPVWLAMACPPAELEAVIAAHAHAMQLAHRMLLILVPADPAEAPALAERCRREDWVIAERAREQEPDPEVQVLVADGQSELGLWYRLAPVTFMGGTLLPGGAGRNPFEPAALGSAILHGPHPGPYPEAYARLAEARAARRIDSPRALAGAVGELIAPDRAASLAHNAWAASSGGAEVAERVIQVILTAMDARPARGAA